MKLDLFCIGKFAAVHTAAEDAAEEESDSEQASEEEQKDKPEDPLFDLGDIMKNLPETDSELKAMIDEML